MRRGTVLLTVAAAALLALPLPTTGEPAARAAVDPGPVLTSVTLSTGTVSVKGLDTVPVTVTVTTASGDTTACPGTAGGVELSRTNVNVWDRSATRDLLGPLSCVSATGGVRTYRAVVPVPSTAQGPWRVHVVSFANVYFQDPRTSGLPDATLDVTGTHRPRLRISVAPQPLVYPARDVTITVRASYDNGAPLITRWISITDDGGSLTGCGECPGNTDATGRIVRRLRLSDLRTVIADMPISAGGFYDFWPSYSTTFAPVVVLPKLSAAPVKSWVPHGTNVGVDGRAVASAVQAWYFSPRVDVNLQRLVGRHWRTVSNSTIRPSGHFALVALAPKGPNYYRVSLPAQQHLAAATSHTFVIRGT